MGPVRRRGAGLPLRRAVRDPAQRRGVDAPGRGADRGRAGPLPRLLVVLPARPAAAARRAVGPARAVAADVEGGPGARRGRGRPARLAARPARRRAPVGGAGGVAGGDARPRLPQRPASLPDHARPLPRRAAVPRAPGARGRADGRRRVLAAGVRGLPRARRAARVRRAGRHGARGGAVCGGGARGRRRAVCAVRDPGRPRRRVRAADPLPRARLRRLPVAAVPALLRRPAEHELARRVPVGLRGGAAAVLPPARAGPDPRGRAGRAGAPPPPRT